MRDGIRALLENDPSFQITGEIRTESAIVELCQAVRTPRVIILDIDQSQPALVAGLGEAIRQRYGARLVVLSAAEDEGTVISAIRAGVHAFVPKRSSSQKDLLAAVRTVAAGSSYLSPHLTGRLLDRIRRGDLSESSLSQPINQLSRRELQVLSLVASGNTNKEVAMQLQLSLETVRSYRKALMKKLGVSNAASVTRMALAGGLVPMGPSHATAA